MDADSVGLTLCLHGSAQRLAQACCWQHRKRQSAGSIKEEVVAAKMMFLAKKRGSFPKDLGIDLLILKDKRNREEPYE